MPRPHLPPELLEIPIHRPSLLEVQTQILHPVGRPPLYLVKRRVWDRWCVYSDPCLAKEEKKYLEEGVHSRGYGDGRMYK